MNVPLIEIARHEALLKLEDYKALHESQKTREDERLQSLYKAVSNGARVINVAAAFKFAGLNEKGQPKLAIARADQKEICFHPRKHFEQWSSANSGAGGFSDSRIWNRLSTAKSYVLPRNTFDNEKLESKILRTRVPHIPPRIRPTIKLHNFHILFEVDNWEEYPVD
ncbi:MAG TPA: hypothetical protein VF692_08165, partial [Pyrinomonadaceae bacterium]